MGLDMYLEKHTYVKNWDYMGDDQRHKITVKRAGKPRAGIRPDRISKIVEEVAYWRKANAIHTWFVKNVQDGKDDCGTYYVSAEKLLALKTACDKVLAASKLRKGKVKNGYVAKRGGPFEPVIEDGEVIADPQIAETVLPTASGFFFGSVDYDEHYRRDIEDTSAMIGKLMAEEGDSDFYYHSSW